jgi:CheY-like chemotaxis protein
VASHPESICLPLRSRALGIPIIAASLLTNQHWPDRTVSLSGMKATILCIDDHKGGLNARKMLLEENGYKVLNATNGREGLRLFREHSVDAVVLDYQLSGMSGDVLAVKMKHIKAQVPIMLLSANEPLPKRTRQSVDTFLCKSKPSGVFVSSLQKLLDGSTKPFFSRWLETWKERNQGTSHN